MEAQSRRQTWIARRRRRAQTFWEEDWSLTALLLFLIINIVVFPLAHFEPWGRVIVRGLMSLIILSGAFALIQRPQVLALVWAIALALLLLGFRGAEHPDLRLNILNDLGSALLVGTLLVLMLRQVLRGGPITIRRVQGAVALYLLLGVAWAILFDLIETIQPGSFRVPGAVGKNMLSELSYFSFTTLTTLGLGDILPINPLARSLVMLEALVGQLFPVILIARMVTMEIGYRERRQDAAQERHGRDARLN